MNTADIIIVSLIALAMIFSIVIIVKKRGANCSCSSMCRGDCSSCQGCHNDKSDN